MRRLLVLSLAVVFSASTALATDLNVSVLGQQGEEWLSEITIIEGTVVNYKVVGELSDDVNMGLALVGFDLSFSGGDLGPADVPTEPPMNNFVSDETQELYVGISNPVGTCPPACGYAGTVIDGNLVQVGGGQNTIKNTSGYAPYPIGSVLTYVGTPGQSPPWYPVVLVTGTIPGLTEGTYTLTLSNLFANVIQDSQSGDPFWTTEEITDGGSNNDLTIHVTPPDVVTAGTWESVGTHDLGVGDVGLEMSTDGTSSEPRFSGLSKLVVTFSGAIDPATAGPSAVAVVGNDCADNPVDLSGLTITTTTTDGDTKLEITLTPKLPDCARYRATLTGIQSAGGTPIAGVTELFMTALVGDASNDLRVAANDVAGVRSFVGVEPIDPAQVFHVRCDASNDGRIKANDVAGVRSFVGNDARFIPDP